MMRISALNDSSDDDESQSLSKSRQTTKEAQESAALVLYNQALTLLRQGDEDGARDTFCQLLEAPFVRDAEPPEGKEVLVEPGLVLKYSTYKNLGSMTAQREDYTTAMKYYLEAVMVDSSDVTVWYKIGSIALKLYQYPLARHAFEQGLECQPRHWPCIDNVITVLYALNNYEACLVYISRALQRDPGYIKGISFLEQIFDEQPTLRRHMISHFGNCDQSIFTVEVDPEESDEFIEEALEMRAKKTALCRRAEVPVLEFTMPFTHLTWTNLGTCLIALYEHIASSQSPITYGCKVDLSDYTSREVLEERAAKQAAAEQAAAKRAEVATKQVVEDTESTAPTDRVIQGSPTESSVTVASITESLTTQVSLTQMLTTDASTTEVPTMQTLTMEASTTQASTTETFTAQISTIESIAAQDSALQLPITEVSPLCDVYTTQAAGITDITARQPATTQVVQTTSAAASSIEPAGAPSDDSTAQLSAMEATPAKATAMDTSTTHVSDTEAVVSHFVSQMERSTTETTTTPANSMGTRTTKYELKITQATSTEITKTTATITDVPTTGTVPSHANTTQYSSIQVSFNTEVSSRADPPKPAFSNEQAMYTSVTPNRATTDTMVSTTEQSVTERTGSVMGGMDVEICEAAAVVVPGQNEALAEKEDDRDAATHAVTTGVMDANSQEDIDKHDANCSVLDASVTREPARRGSKRKRGFVAADYTEKRRSMRVRNTGSSNSKQVEDEVKIRDLVISLLPSSLTHARDAEAENSQDGPMDTGRQERLDVGIGSGIEEDQPSAPLLSETESDDVLHYMRTHQTNSGIIDLLNEFLISLAQRALSIWPEDLSSTYIKAYTMLHKHIILPSYFCKDVPNQRIRDMGQMVLVHSELKVDKWIGTRSRATPSPRRSSANPLGPHFAGPKFYSDLSYLDGLSQSQELFVDQWANFIIRVSWMTAKFNMLDNDLQEAIYSFGRTNTYLDYLEKENQVKKSEMDLESKKSETKNYHEGDRKADVMKEKYKEEENVNENDEQKGNAEDAEESKMDIVFDVERAYKQGKGNDGQVAKKLVQKIGKQNKNLEMENTTEMGHQEKGNKRASADSTEEKLDKHKNDIGMGSMVEKLKDAVDGVKKDTTNDMVCGTEHNKENDNEDYKKEDGKKRKEIEKEKEAPGAIIFLPHLHHDNKVTKDNVKQQLESLQRCRSQDKMQDLHDSGEYEKVIQLLLKTFNTPEGPKVLEMEHQERHAQLLLLMESLFNMKDYKRGMIWGEVSFHQALQKYYSMPTDSMRDEWATTMTQILVTIDKCIIEDRAVIAQLTSKCMVRLTQNLMSIIEMAFDVPETAADMAISTMLPWILLYKLIYFEEERQQPTCVEDDDDSFSQAHNCSMNLLELVHEQLGRHAWCCSRDGELLLFAVGEVLGEMRAAERAGLEHPDQKTLDLMLEQCFYCLYGHPNRKKARHLQDHSSSQISLTWNRAVHVFEFFKPKTMPEYDSLKTSTVSAELESLLRRIYIMIPPDFKLPITVDEITAYIEGTSTMPPAIPKGADPELPVMSELYYLLADFYFKNKEGGKAIKFYMQDLCVNPTRFDSWAGMALARASRLEQKLNTSELKASEGKNEGSIWKYTVASLRSFQRALQLDSSNSKLWIEYGALAYQLHAHASRQLKQQPMYPLTDESIIEATTNRSEMLAIAGNCYTKAGECEVEDNEEEWLHHYMLGKVAEKKETNPEEYLRHYKMAMHHLHNERARYPRKITYIYSPPHLAVETLEVFYRLHASIMKYLLKYPKDAPYAMFDAYIQEAADGPFANSREKGKGLKEREGNADDSSNSNLTSPAIPISAASIWTPTTTPDKNKTSPTDDHTYSRQRSVDSARSDAESSNDTARETADGQPIMPIRRALPASASDSMDSMQSPTALVTTVPSASTIVPTALTAHVSDDSKFLTPIATSFCSAVSDDAKLVLAMSTSQPSIVSDEDFLTPIAASFTSGKSDELSEHLILPNASAPSSSFSDLLETEGSLKVVSSTTTEDTTGVFAPEEKESEAVSPDTTCVDELDVVIEQEDISCMDVIISADPEPCSSAADLLSPQTSHSMSQDSILSKDVVPYQPEVTEISNDSSNVESAREDKQQEFKEELTEVGDQNTTETSSKFEPKSEPVDAILEDVGSVVVSAEASVASEVKEQIPADTSVIKMESADAFHVKIEMEDLAEPKTKLDADLGTDTPDSSSQDSATAAELERLKSEISFLNAGSTGMSSSVFVDQFEQDSIKDESECMLSTPPEVKTEVEEDNKDDEDVTSRNEALEALKSELQSLSAAAGSEITPVYDNQVVKIEVDTPQDSPQGFALTEEKEMVIVAIAVNEPLTVSSQGFSTSEEKDKVAVAQNDELLKVSSQGFTISDKKEKVVSTQDVIDERPKVISVPEVNAMKDVEVVRVAGTLEDLSDGGKKVDIVVCIAPEAEANSNQDTVKQEVVYTEQQRIKEEETNKRLAAEQMEVERNLTTDNAVKNVLVKGNDEDENKTESSSIEVNDVESVGDVNIINNRLSPLSITGNITEKDLQAKVGESKTDTQKSKLEDAPTKDGDNSVVNVTDGDKDFANDGSRGASEKRADTAVMFSKVMMQCIKALNLCLFRFPHHYKSLYRLAYVYCNCEEFKNLEFARDLLLGNTNWQHLAHMSSPGLFQDKKSTNFFQGLWRIPIEEIDRSGSFASHMLRSLQLLFPVLVGLKDHKTLFSIHITLARTPDQGRKYLRDTDRLELTRLALVYCINILDGVVKEHAKNKDREVRITFLLDIYKVWNHCVLKQNQLSHSHTINKLLRKAYFTCMKDQIEAKPSVLEQAIRFCQQRQQLAVKSPTTPEPGSRSMPGTPTTKPYNPLEGLPIPTETPQGDFYKSSSGEISGMKANALKGITPLLARGPVSINTKSVTKVAKPYTVKLGSLMRPKTSMAVTGTLSKVLPSTSSISLKGPKAHELPKKVTIGNVLKKPDGKKPTLGTTTSTSAGLGGGTKATKKSFAVPAPFSIFQPGGAGIAGLSSSHAAALYAQLAQMSPEVLVAQYSGAYSQEAMMQQMALASLAAMPYLYSGTTMDPALWSSLAAAQVFQEASSKSKATPPAHQSSTVKSSTTSPSLADVSQKISGLKLQHPALTSNTSEPPKKVAKITPIPTTTSHKTAMSSAASLISSRSDQPLSLTKQDKPLSLSTKTSVSASTSSSSGGRPGPFSPPAHTKFLQGIKASGQIKSQPGLKLSAKTSQLYAVRMSSALAKLSHQPKIGTQQQQQQQQPPIGHSSTQHIEAPSPAKVAKKAEPSSSLMNLDPLNMLATAAQSHKLSTAAMSRPKPSYPLGATAPIQRPIPAPSPPMRSIKGPPTLKRPGCKKARIVPPQAHSLHRSPSAGYTQPVNLTTQSAKGTSPQPKVVSGPKTPYVAHASTTSLLARHLTTSTTSSSPVGVPNRSSGTSIMRPSMVTSRPTASMPQSTSALTRPTTTPRMTTASRPMLGTRSVSVSRPPMGIRAGVVSQQFTARHHSMDVRTQRPTGSMQPAFPQSYGRGKPSQPATLATQAARPHNSDSSDDCIILSSGKDSESD